jgi:VIT1/CCC1 family predicted Fe2+/Mn2+ transporter
LTSWMPLTPVLRRARRWTLPLSLGVSDGILNAHLGRRVRSEAIEAGLVASLSSFAGAALPLLVAGLLPAASWGGLVGALILLGVLGAALATSVQGSRRRWTAGLILAGAVVAAIGSQLNIT